VHQAYANLYFKVKVENKDMGNGVNRKNWGTPGANILVQLQLQPLQFEKHQLLVPGYVPFPWSCGGHWPLAFAPFWPSPLHPLWLQICFSSFLFTPFNLARVFFGVRQRWKGRSL